MDGQRQAKMFHIIKNQGDTKMFIILHILYTTKRTRTNSAGVDVGEGMLIQCWWNYRLIQPLWKTI